MDEKDALEEFEERLEALQEIYEARLDEDLDKIDIQDNVISDCLKNQIQLQLEWEELAKDIEFLCSDLNDECEKMFSVAFRELSMDSHKALSFNEAKIYAQSDELYCTTKKVLNRANTLKAKCTVIVDSLKTRKFILKNFTDLLKDGNDSYII